MAMGALVLAAGAFLTTKANFKKFGTTTVYAVGVGTVAKGMSGHAAITLSTLRAGHTAFFVTQASKTTYRTLVTSSGSSNKWYAK